MIEDELYDKDDKRTGFPIKSGMTNMCIHSVIPANAGIQYMCNIYIPMPGLKRMVL